MEEVYSAVDFDVLLFDHVANKEPKLLAKMYSAKERLELEKKRRSSGKFKSLKEVVAEYNTIVNRKRGAESPLKAPLSKKANVASVDGSDSDVDLVKAGATFEKKREI
ncbi:unnamed protein product [Enterobius vermicularis]|uniref:ING domain-containing protein n=1 Tax=Enterobius vermicularis TaxID=51028 RepID=A0A0N4V452_ENTVE|nr:unnamed protein product [Enterobius vermicularis]